MKCIYFSVVDASYAAVIALAMALASQASAQTSDVVTRTPSRTSLETTGHRSAQHTWSQPQYDKAAVPGARGTNRMEAQDGKEANRSGIDAAANAYIGSDPDLARPLVPCDALGTSARAGMRSGSDSPSGSYALGAAAGAGFDPVTGATSIPRSVSSCISAPGDHDEASSDERTMSVYDELAPDITNGPTGSQHPGTLTLLRPFAD
jgi:hypothetical protein